MILKKISDISLGISEKKDGQMIVRENSEGLKNREEFFLKEKIDLERIVSSKLAHGDKITQVNDQNAGNIIINTDGLITTTKDLWLTVTVSDCMPIYFYDPKRNAVGIVHSGWRGVVNNISVKMIQAFRENYQSELDDIKVYIGPHIKSCHFEIKKDVLDKFEKYPNTILSKDEKIYIDLETIIREELTKNGVLNSNIESNKECTFCNESFYSFRRDKPPQPVSQIAYIGIN